MVANVLTRSRCVVQLNIVTVVAAIFTQCSLDSRPYKLASFCTHLPLYSQYQVNISEVHSSLSLYSGWDYTEYTALAHMPLRPPSDYHTLSDIISAGQSMDGSHVNIQAVVKHVSIS